MGRAHGWGVIRKRGKGAKRRGRKRGQRGRREQRGQSGSVVVFRLSLRGFGTVSENVRPTLSSCLSRRRGDMSVLENGTPILRRGRHVTPSCWLLTK